MTLLDGDIRSLFQSVFSGIYDAGTLTTVTQVSDGIGGLSQTTSTQACSVQRDDLTEAQRLELGYAPTDVRLIILRNVNVKTGDRVAIYGQTYSIGPNVQTDSANSHWVCRGIRYG